MLQHHLRRRRTVTTKGGITLPRTGLLFYSRLPNAYLHIDWDEELGWESPMLGYQATPGDDALFAAAPQLYDGDADSPLILSDTEILALSGINTTVNGIEVSFSVAAGLAVRWHRIAYIPNAYPFVDKDGGDGIIRVSGTGTVLTDMDTYTLPVSWIAALGATGVDHWAYMSLGVPKEVSGAVIKAHCNTDTLLYSDRKGLVIYAENTPEAVLLKACKYFKVIYGEVYYDTDLDGNSIFGTPDIGAYEFPLYGQEKFGVDAD